MFSVFNTVNPVANILLENYDCTSSDTVSRLKCRDNDNFYVWALHAFDDYLFFVCCLSVCLSICLFVLTSINSI